MFYGSIIERAAAAAVPHAGQGAGRRRQNEAPCAACGATTCVDLEFCQDNESFSSLSGTVRGLHFQVEPHTQGKLVRVLHGAIFDVAVDIRPESATFGQHASVELKARDNRSVWIPAGFAHGFCTLADETVVSYKATDFYAPDCERSIRFDDPDLGIDWPVDSADAVVSDKDAAAPSFAEFLQGLP